MLISSIIGGSFIGTASNMLETEDSWIKVQMGFMLRFKYAIILLLIELSIKRGAYVSKVKTSLT